MKYTVSGVIDILDGELEDPNTDVRITLASWIDLDCMVVELQVEKMEEL